MLRSRKLICIFISVILVLHCYFPVTSQAASKTYSVSITSPKASKSIILSELGNELNIQWSSNGTYFLVSLKNTTTGNYVMNRMKTTKKSIYTTLYERGSYRLAVAVVDPATNKEKWVELNFTINGGRNNKLKYLTSSSYGGVWTSKKAPSGYSKFKDMSNGEKNYYKVIYVSSEMAKVLADKTVTEYINNLVQYDIEDLKADTLKSGLYCISKKFVPVLEAYESAKLIYDTVDTLNRCCRYSDAADKGFGLCIGFYKRWVITRYGVNEVIGKDYRFWTNDEIYNVLDQKGTFHEKYWLSDDKE